MRMRKGTKGNRSTLVLNRARKNQSLTQVQVELKKASLQFIWILGQEKNLSSERILQVNRFTDFFPHNEQLMYEIPEYHEDANTTDAIFHMIIKNTYNRFQSIQFNRSLFSYHWCLAQTQTRCHCPQNAFCVFFWISFFSFPFSSSSSFSLL